MFDFFIGLGLVFTIALYFILGLYSFMQRKVKREYKCVTIISIITLFVLMSYAAEKLFIN